MPKSSSGWNPRTFQEVVARVHGGSETGIDVIGLTLGIGGAKDVPAPTWDPHGTYRLALVGKVPTIQRLDENNKWVAAPLQGPSAQMKKPEDASVTDIETRSRNILFMDVSGWSQLGAKEILSYATNAMPQLRPLIVGSEFLNTWGDAIVATFDSAKNAAESALRIRDFFERGLPKDGVPRGLTCRISLHQGEIIVCQNALTNTKDIFGDAVHVAARLEPMTAPGHAFCTSNFATALGAIDELGPRAWPIGPLELPKGFGVVEASVVTWSNEKDPRPGLPPQKSSTPAPVTPRASSKPTKTEAKRTPAQIQKRMAILAQFMNDCAAITTGRQSLDDEKVQTAMASINENHLAVRNAIAESGVPSRVQQFGQVFDVIENVLNLSDWDDDLQRLSYQVAQRAFGYYKLLLEDPELIAR